MPPEKEPGKHFVAAINGDPILALLCACDEISYLINHVEAYGGRIIADGARERLETYRATYHHARDKAGSAHG